MGIAEKHYNDGKAHADFCGSNYHDKEHKQLCLASCCWVVGAVSKMIHFRKSHQQQIDGIQHKLDAHENDNGISAGKHTYDANHKQSNGKK